MLMHLDGSLVTQLTSLMATRPFPLDVREGLDRNGKFYVVVDAEGEALFSIEDRQTATFINAMLNTLNGAAAMLKTHARVTPSIACSSVTTVDIDGTNLNVPQIYVNPQTVIDPDGEYMDLVNKEGKVYGRLIMDESVLDNIAKIQMDK